MTLDVHHLSFSYDQHSILKDVSFCLKKGEIGTIIGASGSGKSTLFKILTGLLEPQKGEILIQGQVIKERSQQIAYMMQEDLLLPWRTVLGNLLLIYELGSSHSEQQEDPKQEALNLLEEMDLLPYVNYYPDELSGGMRQRVSLARALMRKRNLLLLDEPFGALDVGRREHMYRLLHRIQKRYDTTILMVTHDFRDALSLSDRLFWLCQGRIEKEWQISLSARQDFGYMGHLQQEIQQLLYV